MKASVIKNIVLIISPFLVFNQNLFAGNGTSILGQNLAANVNVVTTAVPFLLIGPDARAGGMGDAGVASMPDANSIHWNPAKLAFIPDSDKMGFSVSYTPWLRQLVPDINLSYLSFYYKLPNHQTIGS
ncbi:MAG TPA: PorV/PorQ family protein, partial [Bacteroidia bacterium]|nr:PorV/PorQ family protein [Bacteroidia bacterium]